MLRGNNISELFFMAEVLAKQLPGLPTQQAFVFTKLRKLAPSADVDVEFDAAEREAWLERLWAYAKTLSPTFYATHYPLLATPRFAPPTAWRRSTRRAPPSRI